MDLPSGMDVYAILISALQSNEYRGKLLHLVGLLWGAGFTCGLIFGGLIGGRRDKR